MEQFLSYSIKCVLKSYPYRKNTHEIVPTPDTDLTSMRYTVPLARVPLVLYYTVPLARVPLVLYYTLPLARVPLVLYCTIS